MKESLLDTKSLQILSILKKVKGSYVSGESLSKKSDVSHAAIWKHVSTLKEYGYTISSKKGEGYKLLNESTQLLPWEITEHLQCKLIGRIVRHFCTIDSTQDFAIKLAEGNALEGTAVIAERQKKGRGRMGRKWVAPEGGIWLSVILRPSIPTAESTVLPLAGALAVCKAIRKICKVDAKLKWPNDILITGKKVGGILAEMSSEADRVNYVAIGVGVNANVPLKKIETRVKRTPGYHGVTSLLMETGKPVDRIRLVQHIFAELEYVYHKLTKESSDTLIQSWKDLSGMLGHDITISQNETFFEAKALDVDHDGALLVRLPSGNIKRIVAGDVYVRRIKK